MTTAFALFAKVAKGLLPARVLLFGLCNTLSRKFRPGKRRFEFERLYLEHGDVWDFESSPYETEKYKRTLDRILEHRRGNNKVLELGCSFGVFSGMLAEHFDSVVASDFSREALTKAGARNANHKNVQFVHSYIQSFAIAQRFDVIICAEVLYYILEREAEAVRRVIAAHLNGDGIVVLVQGIPPSEDDAHHYSGWEEQFSKDMRLIHREQVDAHLRPYEILIFARTLKSVLE